MLAPAYCKNLLDALFGVVDASKNTTPQKELSALSDFRQDKSLSSVLQSTFSFETGDYDSNVKFYVTAQTLKDLASTSDLTPEQITSLGNLNEFISEVDKCSFFQYVKLDSIQDKDTVAKYVKDYPELEFYTPELVGSEVKNVYYYGSIVIPKGTRTFPTTRYLGLLTALPERIDDEGNYDYTEITAEGYSRVDLNSDYFNQEQIMSKAKLNEAEEGGTISMNENYTIYFSPTLTSEWANEDTQIKGFAIFEEQTGGNPYIWGEVTSEDAGTVMGIPANKVPLFRKNQFTISIA